MSATSSPRSLRLQRRSSRLTFDIDRQRLEALPRLAEARQLRPQVEAVLPLEQVREALERVAGRHNRGKVVLQIGQ